MPTVLKLATTLAALYLAACAALYFFQRAMIYFPQPSAFGLPDSRLVMELPDAKLLLTIHKPPAANAKTKALIYFGGNAEDVSAQLAPFARAFPEYTVYLLHYRGFGGSTGALSEAALHADARAVFDNVVENHSQVAVVGRSLGSGIAIQLASQRPVARLILVTPYDSIESVAAKQYKWFPVSWLLKDKFESWRYAPLIKVPTLVVTSQFDDVIPHEHTQRLLGFFQQGVANHVMIAGCDHNSISNQADYLARLRAVL